MLDGRKGEGVYICKMMVNCTDRYAHVRGWERGGQSDGREMVEERKTIKCSSPQLVTVRSDAVQYCMTRHTQTVIR